jgi:hypothetical protein
MEYVDKNRDRENCPSSTNHANDNSHNNKGDTSEYSHAIEDIVTEIVLLSREHQIGYHRVP